MAAVGDPVVRPVAEHWEIHLSCPHCGAPTRPVAEGNAMEGGRTISAIVQCAGECRVQSSTWQIMVRLLPLHPREVRYG